MLEIDTVFSLKQTYALLAIYEQMLMEKGIITAEDMLKFIHDKKISPNGIQKTFLEELVFDEFKKSKDNKKVGRFSKYKDLEESFIKKITNKELEDKIIILTDSIGINERGEKKGCDPYSNYFEFSNKLPLLGKLFNQKFLDNIVFTYINPIIFNQTFLNHKKNTLIVDLLNKKQLDSDESIEYLINQKMFVKDKDFTPRIGISNYNLSMFNYDALENVINQNREKYIKENLREDENSYQLLERKKAKILFNKIIQATRWAYYLDKLYPSIVKTMDKYQLQGIPLMMNKTSASYDILQKAKKISETNPSFELIGGKKGINAGERVMKGIHEDASFRRVIGFLDSIYPERYDRSLKLNLPKINNTNIELVSDDRVGWALIEKPLRNANPIMTDIILAKEQDPEKQKRKEICQDIVNKFTGQKAVGYSRIEVHVANLLNQEKSIYFERRNRIKLNLWWRNELKGKEVIFPYDVKELFGESITFLQDQDPKRNINSEFRGSEFSTSADCSIQKVISNLTRYKTYDILTKIIEDEQEIKNLDMFYEPTLKEPVAAIRGTTLHEFILNPYPNLAHYDTLKLAGLDPVPSNYYCETEFIMNYKGAKVSFHPDTFLLLKNQDNLFDILIMDVKTNRVTTYPRIPYLKQMGFYGRLIANVLNKNEVKTGNIYVVPIHNSFDDDFDKGLGINKKKYKIFRPQKLAPVTKFSPGSPFLRELKKRYKITIEEKRSLSTNNKSFFFSIKKESKNAHNCNHCYSTDKTICDYVSENDNIGLMDVADI